MHLQSPRERYGRATHTTSSSSSRNIAGTPRDANSWRGTAGISLSEVAKTPTGCYVGCFRWDYAAMLKADVDARSRYLGLNSPSTLSNRVSWLFDFRGPSMTIDAACSSGLVTVSEACIGLELRETSTVRFSVASRPPSPDFELGNRRAQAVVGGCNFTLSPDLTLELGALGVLAL